MKTISVPWGTSSVDVSLPEEQVAWVVSPRAIPGAPDEAEEIRRAMRSPIGCPPIPEQIGDPAGKRIAIVVDDNTRATPVNRILPVVVDELNSYGIRDEQITVIMALGSHRAMTEDEVRERVGEDCFRRLKVINHEYDNPDKLSHVGETIFHTPVYVNRTFVDADFGMCIGNIIPHFVAGWSGGAKSIQPGISGKETTAVVHLRSSLDWPDRFGNEENDIRRDMEDIARKAGLKFIVNTVLNLKEEIVHVVCGDPVAAHRAGVGYAREVYQEILQERPDVVIVGAYPASRDLWQANKSIAAACQCVREHGTIISLAPCYEGSYSEHPSVIELGDAEPEEVFKMCEEGTFQDVVGATGFISAGIMRRMARIILVTEGLNEETAKHLGYSYAADVNAAIEMAKRQERGENTRFGILTHGADLAPKIADP